MLHVDEADDTTKDELSAQTTHKSQAWIKKGSWKKYNTKVFALKQIL